MRSIMLFAICLLLSAAAAASDPVVDKLTRVSDLSEEEMLDVLGLYRKLYLELESIGERPTGRTSAEQRNLVESAYERHRRASLRYLRPNQYRRWMTVAGRWLPGNRPGPAFVPGFEQRDTSQIESPAAVAFRATQ